MYFLRGKSSTNFGCYELKLAKTMEAFLSEEEKRLLEAMAFENPALLPRLDSFRRLISSLDSSEG